MFIGTKKIFLSSTYPHAFSKSPNYTAFWETTLMWGWRVPRPRRSIHTVFSFLQNRRRCYQPW